MPVKVLFAIGILLAAVAAFYDSPFLPWLVGGTGILTGILAWRDRTRGILVAAIALVVALSAIREQPFNPDWLTDVVFFVRVFVAHVALAASVLAVFAPRE